MTTESALSTLSRYEAFFELTAEINASTEIEQVGQLLARRLKYVADVFSWRYVSFGSEDGLALPAEAEVIVIDGFRGTASVDHVPKAQLCDVEMSLWKAKRSRFIEGDELEAAKTTLPEQFRKDRIVQLYVCPRFGAGGLESMLIYSTTRRPFNDLDVKFLSHAAHVFHDKVFRLWEQQKLRALEVAYLQQEITLRQSEKLATLGRLSAGMAHELNNPASAAQRGAEQLRTEVVRLDRALRRLAETGLSRSQGAALDDLIDWTDENTRRLTNLDPLDRVDLEAEVEEWLDDSGLEEAWELAPTLASMGLNAEKLSELAGSFERDQLPEVVAALGSTYAAGTLLAEVREGATRVVELVKALKSYSYLDQAPIQSIDVHEGLEDTLTMFGSRLRDGITVRREYDEELPRIQAYGTELNQVWTNIVDNAISAMEGRGELTLRTRREEPWAVVEIVDSGPGIPEEIHPHLFDPFFTTKQPGEGTGLGLNISHNIVVQKHKGRIGVRSRPGHTSFEVRLPLELDTGSSED